MSLNHRVVLSVALLGVLVACGDEDDDFIPDPYGDIDVIDGPADEDVTDDDGDDDPGDVDDGDGDGGPTNDDPPPPVYGLDARPSQQTCTAFTAPPVTDDIAFVDRFPGIRFSAPVSMTQRPGDNSRFYVNERAGMIWSFPNDPTAEDADKVPALDLTDVVWAGVDCSTAALVFPPDFETSHVAYVAYCHRHPGNHVQVRLSRFASEDGGLTFDRGSEQVLIAINYLETADPTDPEYTRACNHDFGDGGLHAGDAAHFGPDGYLYWSVGDGGPQGHCGGKQAQHLSSLRGKLLRIDVSDLTKQIAPADLAFAEGMQHTAVDIPPGNPFFGTGEDPNPTYNLEAGVVQPLIYAYGFRNPWQWHFDTADGSIWLGDVGNNTWEEVNRIVAGGNYGWGYFEGYHCANGWASNEYPDDGMAPVVAACSTQASQLRWPFLEIRHGASYDRGATPEASRLPAEIYGRAISGGLVYRGAGVPAYSGSYFFGDYSEARIWAVRDVDALGTVTGTPCTTSADCGPGLKCKALELPWENGIDPDIVDDTPPVASDARCQADFEVVQTGVPVAAFGRDQDDEVYAVMLYNAPGDGAQGWIGMLRATAATGGSGGPPALLSETGCFEVIDDAVGEPVDDLIPFAPAAELWSDGAGKRRWLTVPDALAITVDASGDFELPPGSVLIKEFSLFGRKIETRFLVRQTADGRWAGYTYAWNTAETDATLVPEVGDEQTWGTDPDEQLWHYPGRTQCFRCHNAVDKVALGPETAQLNNAIVYPATGKTANQMATLEHIGLVDTSNAPAPWPSLAAITDTSRSVAERARSYLHANCSICHRPDGPTFTPPDFRYTTAFAAMNICDAQPSISDMGEPTSRLLVPANPALSQIHMRPASTDGAYRMPPLATDMPHTAALEVLADWITSITTCE